MYAKLEKIPLYPTSSITVKREITPYMDYPWHYHPEYEIIYVEKSYGIRLMGSHIGNFSNGDLMFMSPNLPHVWRNDHDFYQGNTNLKVDVYVIHFREESLAPGFFDLPELAEIKKLFIRGQQGVFIKGRDRTLIANLVKRVYQTTGMERLLFFLKTLRAFSESTNYDLLSTPGYVNSVNTTDTERINRVMEYLVNNYSKDIKLEEVVELVNMNKASFCRYFKLRTHKTYSLFLNEIRILHACKQLVDNKKSITEICYEVGYNNISHFNRQFKQIIGTTAKEYRMKYVDSAVQKL